MPTVRNDIEPRVVFPSAKGKTNVSRVSIYPAEHWDKWGGKPGRYRIMLGEQWVTRRGERVSFFTQKGCEQYMGRWALKALGVKVDKALPPSVPIGTLVWVRGEMPKESGEAWLPTRTRTLPFVDEHGEWVVWIGLRKRPVLLADLQPREDGRGYRSDEGVVGNNID
jgi:hypothetical protein